MGIIGSTEWVEQNADALSANAVAYLNQDILRAPPLAPAPRRRSSRSSARPPRDSLPARERWAGSGRARTRRSPSATRRRLRPRRLLPSPGIASAGHGFGGPYGLYHSSYDTREAVEIVDPGYRNQTLSSELVAVLALRLANAEVLPFDYAAFAHELEDLWRQQRAQAVAAPASGEAVGGLDAALNTLAAADGASRPCARTISRGAWIRRGAGPPTTRCARGRARADPRGRPGGRPWNRNLVFATDDRNGYATLALPGSPRP